MTTELQEIIHNEIKPIKQMFLTYEQLSINPSIRFNAKIFRKCADKCDQLIHIAFTIQKVKEG